MKLYRSRPASESEIFRAVSPFSTYCSLQDLCHTSIKRFFLVDGYLDDTIFYRYLRLLPDTVMVTLVTRPINIYQETVRTLLMDVSRLYAAERPTMYHLMTHENVHDRYLWCDEVIYTLGGSLKDAGKKGLTVTKMDFSTGHKTINDLQNISKNFSEKIIHSIPNRSRC